MNKLELIIPTYNRPGFLQRILNYYNSYKVNFKIIIADSSNQLNKKLNKKTAFSFPKLNILYVDKFLEKQPSHQKYAGMVKYIKSKYCVFCPDDDFIVPNGIKEAVDFLEKNPSYATAHGTYISFYVYNNPIGSKKFWWKFVYPYKSIVSSNPAERLAEHISSYYQVLWAVRRTDVVKLAYKEFLKSTVDPLLFGELLPDMLTLIFGKMKRLSTFYSARQAFSTSYSYWPSLIDAQKEGIYNNEYARFRNCLAENLTKYGSSKNKSLQIIDSSMEVYLKTTVQEHLMGRANLMLKYFPSFIKTGVRLLHAKYLFSKNKRDRVGLVDNRLSKYFNDFETIRRTVLKHNV